MPTDKLLLNRIQLVTAQYKAKLRRSDKIWISYHIKIFENIITKMIQDPSREFLISLAFYIAEYYRRRLRFPSRVEAWESLEDCCDQLLNKKNDLKSNSEAEKLFELIINDELYYKIINNKQ